MPSARLTLTIAVIGATTTGFLGLVPLAEQSLVPAQAQDAALREGDVVPRGTARIIEDTGRFGLGPEQPGSLYAIVDGNLVRLDKKSYKILSVLRRHVGSGQ